MKAKDMVDIVEFETYVMNCAAPLCPNTRDENGKRILLKASFGPGWMNASLLVNLHHLGFILFHRVNTTTVKQETDRNYGQFKT